MLIIPTEHKTTGSPPQSGLMALVQGWLAALPPDGDVAGMRRAALRRELDAFAWQLVGRLHGVDAEAEDLSPEIPLDMDKPNR